MATLFQMFLSFPATMWSGYALSIMWAWYAEPIGAPHLSIVRAIGLSMVAHMLTGHAVMPEHKPVGEKFTAGEKLLGNMLIWLFAPALSLFFGWIWKHWL